jgi:hypothetical protein
MNIRRWLAFGACTSALGCYPSVQATPLNAPTQPLTPRATEAVQVYSSTLPARPHQDVAIIQVHQDDGRGLAAMIEKARHLAGEMGCDAIFITSADRHASAPPGSGWALILADTELLYATCLEWLGPPPPAALATTPPPPIAVVAATAPTPAAPVKR